MPTRCDRWFLLQILLLAQHVSGTIMPIIRSSRVLYKWMLPVVFGAWFSSYRYVVELRFAAAAARKWDTQRSAPHHTDNLKTKAPNTIGSNYLCNTLELLMMGIMVPETCWASNKICNKNHLSHLVGILFPHISYKFRHRECMGLQEYVEGNAFGQLVPNALYAEDCFDDSPVLLVCLAGSIYVSTVSVLPLT